VSDYEFMIVYLDDGEKYAKFGNIEANLKYLILSKLF
jgi:hypothetical protein